MDSFLDIVIVVSLLWIAVSIGFALFWSVLKRREPKIEEAEDALASDL